MRIINPRKSIRGRPFVKNDMRINRKGTTPSRRKGGCMLSLNDYQRRAHATAIYTRDRTYKGLVYCSLKLCGEAGELAEQLGKAMRDDGRITLDRHQKMQKELGDVLWYVAAVATELGVTLDDIGHQNLAKLRDRMERGVIRGSGDNR